MIKTDPNLKSHFSYQTGVSLLLPTDWQEVQRPGFAASYLTLTEQPSPSLGIQVFPGGEAGPETYKQVAQMMLEMPLPDFKLLYQADSSLDGYPALVFTASWQDKATGLPLIQHVAVAQVDTYLFPIIGLVTPDLSDKYLPILNSAMRSIRFISMLDDED